MYLLARRGLRRSEAATETSPDSPRSSGRSESSGGRDRPSTCYQCGKPREEHEDKRFCRKEIISVAIEGESLDSYLASVATKNIVQIETLDDFRDALEERETSRPPGYGACTTLRFGGLDVKVLLDSGATCSAMSSCRCRRRTM